MNKESPEIDQTGGQIEEASEVGFDENLLHEFREEIQDICSYGKSFEERHKLLENLGRFDQLVDDIFKSDSLYAQFKVLDSLEMLAGETNNNEPDSDKMYDNEIVKFALSKMERLLPVIEETGEKYPYRVNSLLRVYSELASKGSVEQKHLGTDALYKRINSFAKDLRDPKTYFNSLLYIKQIIYSGNFEQSQEALYVLFKAAVACEDAEHFPSLTAGFFDSSNMELEGLEILRSYLEGISLPYSEILEAWKVSNKSDLFGQAVFSNLKVIGEVEKAEPGTCKFLYDGFGITDFGRYPAELLLKQKKEFENLENPYGVIIFPRNDWNGAFYSDNNALGDFLKELDGKFCLRVFECESKMDIARALVTSNQRYNPDNGKGHKISLLILGGHGTENSIQFGGKDERHSLTTDDLFGHGIQKTGQFFEENPTIILSSCSTGAEGGIGQELSKKFGAKVIAPKVPTGLEAIHGSKRRGQDKFRFNAVYSKGANIKSLYKMGKKEPQ